MDTCGFFPFYFRICEDVISGFFPWEVLWKLGECEKWFVTGRWQISIINLKSLMINIKAINF